MEDLLDFGSAPAPAPAAADDFGAFQGTAAPAPAAAADDFADFDQIRSKNTGPDPFASAPAPAAFNAFGNNNAAPSNNNMMANNNNMMMNNNMAAMGNAFNNMSVGTPSGGMQQPAMPASNDDDFGDFETAAKPTSPAIAMKQTVSNPMAGLINLDGLSKNVSKKKPFAPNAAAAQYQQAMQNGVQNGGQQPQGM